MDHFSELLASRLQHHKLSKEAYASLVLEKMKQIIESHFGEDSSSFLVADKYSEKIIYITAYNSVWRQSLYPYRNIFLKILQHDFPNEGIKKIVVL